MSSYSIKRGITNPLTLGSGLTIPQLGFGTYRMDPSACSGAIKTAILEAGFRHIDCAPVYQNEPEVGQALSEIFSRTNLSDHIRTGSHAPRIQRKDLFITSKLWCTDQHPENVKPALKRTLEALRVDYLDLYLIHWPVCWAHPKQASDYKTNPDEAWRPIDAATGAMRVIPEVRLADTWKAMEELVKEGLVKSIGVSNCGEKELDSIFESEPTQPIATNQVELHPGCQPADLGAYHAQNGILTSAYCPLGAPTRFTPEGYEGLMNDTFIQKIAANSGYKPARLLLNWALDNECAVIVKSATRERILDNAKAETGRLGSGARQVLSYYPVERGGPIRVINPVGFKGVAGESWFPPESLEQIQEE